MDTGKKCSQCDYTLASKLSHADQAEKGELSINRLNGALTSNLHRQSVALD